MRVAVRLVLFVGEEEPKEDKFTLTICLQPLFCVIQAIDEMRVSPDYPSISTSSKDGGFTSDIIDVSIPTLGRSEYDNECKTASAYASACLRECFSEIEDEGAAMSAFIGVVRKRFLPAVEE